MNEPIQKYFRVGLVAGMAYASAPAAVRWAEIVGRIARDEYFDAVEVNPLPDDETRRQVAALAAQGHMRLYCNAHARLLSAGLNPNDPDEAGRKRAEEALLAGVDEAAALGIHTMGLLAGRWTPETRERCFAQLRKTVVNVCRYARERGILIELEIFDCDIAKKALLGPAPLTARFAAAVRAEVPNFGLMADLSHMPMTRETPEQVVSVLRPWLTHFHIGNTVIRDPSAPAYGDEHPRFGFPHSENDGPELTAFLRVLKQNGFFCAENPYTLTFEIKPRANEDVDVILANAKRTLNHAWALVD